MAKLLPIKARILEWCILNDRPISAAELSELLSEDYKNEKTIRPENIEKQMLCYCRVGMLKPVGLSEKHSEPTLEYQVTDAGKAELVYIPGHGNRMF